MCRRTADYAQPAHFCCTHSQRRPDVTWVWTPYVLSARLPRSAVVCISGEGAASDVGQPTIDALLDPRTLNEQRWTAEHATYAQWPEGSHRSKAASRPESWCPLTRFPSNPYEVAAPTPTIRETLHYLDAFPHLSAVDAGSSRTGVGSGG